MNLIQWAWSLLFGIGSLIWQQVCLEDDPSMKLIFLHFQILLFIPIKPFASCFSAIYRVCCPCIYKRRKRKHEEDGKGEETDEKVSKPKSKEGEGEGDGDDQKYIENPGRYVAALGKYSTIVQLTNATVVAKPPPVFTRYMLRKSVDRLNSEVSFCLLMIV